MQNKEKQTNKFGAVFDDHLHPSGVILVNSKFSKQKVS